MQKKAFDLYKTVFGGEFASKMTWGDSPCCDQVKKAVDEIAAKKIMHASLPQGSGTNLMGCDTNPAANCGSKSKAGSNVSFSVHPDSKAEAEKLMAALSTNGGSVEMALSDQLWGGYFGMCTDLWYTMDDSF
jgi:PhnB protein